METSGWRIRTAIFTGGGGANSPYVHHAFSRKSVLRDTVKECCKLDVWRTELTFLRVGRGWNGWMGILWMKLGLINQSTFIYRFSKNFRNGYTFLFIRFCMICLLSSSFYIYLWNIFFFHFCKVVEGWTFMMRIINIRVLMRFGTRSNFFWFENYLKFMSKS